jgi:hypothetical protein
MGIDDIEPIEPSVIAPDLETEESLPLDDMEDMKDLDNEGYSSPSVDDEDDDY